MHIDFKDLRATYNELVRDVDLSKGLDTDVCSEAFIKRTYARAFFAMVEGIIAQLKQLALHANAESRVFEVFELELLEERVGYLDSSDGTAKPGNAKLSFLPNLQFSMTSAARALNLDFKLEKGGQGWLAMRDSVKIRDRITHPKNMDSLVISDDEMKKLGQANAWFRDETVRLIDLIRGSHEVV
jgi:hypothetical protein